jgi:hypothetical protein
MAKANKRPKKKGPGLFARAGKSFGKAFDGSAEWVAKHTGGKPSKERRASLEWTSKAQGNGDHLPMTPVGMRWTAQHTQKDKEIWRATFVDGYVHKFVTWPPRDHVEAVALAHDAVVKLYGVYAETWEVVAVEKVGLAVEDELTEDAKA